MSKAVTDQIVVPYIGTWIETGIGANKRQKRAVVPYIGTWIETTTRLKGFFRDIVVPYIGTWIETGDYPDHDQDFGGRTLYRYVD